MRGEDVDVCALREARVEEDLLECECRLGALLGVLQNDSVAEDQVGHREARDLVVGVVPRHDAQHDADALEAEEALQAVFDLELLVCEPLLGVRRERGGNAARELCLADRLVEGLAHLAVDDGAEFFLALIEQLCCALGEGRTLGDGGLARPLRVGLLSIGERRLDLCCGGGRVLLDGFTGCRVNDGVLEHEQITPL